jgi:hypothetical protein
MYFPRIFELPAIFELWRMNESAMAQLSPISTPSPIIELLIAQSTPIVDPAPIELPPEITDPSPIVHPGPA